LWHPLLDQGRKRRRKAGFFICATKPSWRTAVEDAKLWRHGRRSRDWRRNGRRWRLGPRCGRGGDVRRAASRAVRRPRRKLRPGPRRGGGNLPACRVLAVFSKPATSPGFVDPSKPWIRSASTWRHRGEGFESKKETPPSDEILYPFRFCPYECFNVRVRVEVISGKGPVCETGLTGRPRGHINTSHLPPWTGEPPNHESFLFFLAPLSVLGLGRGLHGKVV